MRTAIITARLSSSRVPGKVLDQSLPEPPVAYLYKRLQCSNCFDQIYLATTSQPADQPLRSWANSAGLRYFAGAAEDVLSRLIHTCDHYDLESFALIGADCPFTDIRLLGAAYDYFILHNLDYIHNYSDSGMPEGLDINIVRTSALKQSDSLASGCLRSHPLLSLLISTDIFAVKDFAIPTTIDLSHWHLSYDYPKDRSLILYFMKNLPISHNLHDIIQFIASDPKAFALVQSCSIANSTSSIWNSPSMISDLFLEISKLAHKASAEQSIENIKSKLSLIYSIASYLHVSA